MSYKETPWYELFKQLNIALNHYYNNCENKNQKAGVQLYKLAFNDRSFKELNKWIYSTSFEHESLDPIHVFTSLAAANLKAPIRNARIQRWLFLLTNEIKSINADFTGCPQIPPVKVLSSRPVEQQDEIWELYIRISGDVRFPFVNPSDFENFRNWYGINISSFTIFLFWVNSKTFLPLDKNTVELLIRAGVIGEIPTSYKIYKELCDKARNKRSDLIRDMVSLAYEVTKKGESIDYRDVMSQYLDTSRDEVASNLNQNFKLVAIRPRLKNNAKQLHSKNLKDELFYFYQAYQINETDDVITYTPHVGEHLYNQDNLKISVSAIVGKNGSGKSAITELLFLGINKLSKELLDTDESRKLEDEEIYLDLYILSDHLYKLTIDEHIKVYQYRFDNNKFQSPYTIDNQRILRSFCYSIVVNYSLYGLNSNILGNWIYQLFYKNDAYQIPVAFNPRRKEGIIDVNREEQLAHQRLLANVLEPELNLQANIVPEIAENKIPQKLILIFDHKKLEEKWGEFKKSTPDGRYIPQLIKKIFGYLGFEMKSGLPYAQLIKEYIFLKLIGIGYSYVDYRDYIKKDNDGVFEDFENLEEYVFTLYGTNSHITYKVKQAINYLRFGHLKIRETRKEQSLDIIELSQEINKVQQEVSRKEVKNSKEEILTVELIPPAIFSTSIEFSNGSNFKDLSSGEKQKIFAINSVVYHLNNINSVEQTENVKKYTYANIIFDEVELYFHPDMQRTFIHDLIKRIGSMTLNEITGLNFLFVTHSPFILSDIPLKNTLMLEGGKTSQRKAYQTFGANVHDLLAHEFFMENGFMGKYAQNIIDEIVAFLIFKKIEKNPEEFEKPEEQMKKLKDKYKPLEPQEYLALIDLIGEEVLRSKLRSMYFEVFESEEESRKRVLEYIKESGFTIDPKNLK